MNLSIRALLKGIASYIPFFYKQITTPGTGGTISARYCYTVWLRHLCVAHYNNLSTWPNVIAELGPGDSLGIGLAALISGVNKYYAFDVVKHSNNKRNLDIFYKLLELFKKHEKIPDDSEFPRVYPRLKSYDFPSHFLTEERLNIALEPSRIEAIIKALSDLEHPVDSDIEISYLAPWYDSEILKESSIDMIYSQAVLEHVDDLDFTYKTMFHWLKPNGFISHLIDFKSHGTSREWNGHWTYSDFMWKLIIGKRPYLLNRLPLETHISLLKEVGFEIVCEDKLKSPCHFQRSCLAQKFKGISDEDLSTSVAFIQAIKIHDVNN